MSRWGGFRKGRKRYARNWSDLKSANSFREATVATTAENFSYVEAQGIWNLNSTMQFPKSNQYLPTSIEFVGYAVGANNVNIPTVQDGDIGILVTAAHGLAIAKVWPADFTEVKEDSDTDDSRMVSGYKILSASDSNALVTGMNDTSDWIMILVFRPSRTLTSVEVFSVNGQATISDPAVQTIDMSAITSSYHSVIALAFMSGTAALADSTSPQMTEISAGSTASSFYTIFNAGSTLSSIDVDMPDEGDNVMQSWGLAVS